MFYIPILLRSFLNEAVKFEASSFTLLGQMALLVMLPYILSQTIVHLLHQQWLIKHKIISKGCTLFLLFGIIVVSVGKVADQLVWRADSFWLVGANLQCFASVQIVYFVPESKIWSVLKFVRCADARCNLLR